jgi:hypothetical protein
MVGPRWNQHERSTLGKGLGRPGPQGTGEPRLHRAEGRAAGEGAARLARQFLLALCRYRRVHAAILTRWHEVAAEQIIANVEAASKDEDPLALLLRRVFGERLTLERAVRTWASVDPPPAPPCRPSTAAAELCGGAADPIRIIAELARARAQVLYWAFLGFALSDQPLPKARQQAVLDELLRIAAS